MTDTTERQRILDALYTFIHQRPGLDYGNYGDPASYRAEVRSIGRDLREARYLLGAVERSGITAEALQEAFHAFSGRLTWDGQTLDYCTGQYWPTEYRKAVAAVCASALWAYTRDYCMPPPDAGATPDADRTYAGKSAGQWLRDAFRREFGRSMQHRWFN